MFESHSGSFRDPCGYIFKLDGKVYRHVLPPGIDDYRSLIESGLYKTLTDRDQLVSHVEVSDEPAFTDLGLVILPAQVPFISYPYEWSFSQLKDAALLTLDVCKTAVAHGMILKDASGFNVQYVKGRPLFIDTGSFAPYSEGQPWEGYKQFCQHFLAPLLLASKVDIGLLKLLESYIDGIPLEVASKLLPKKSWLSWKVFAHVHMHARVQKKYSDKTSAGSARPAVSKNGLLGILDGLTNAIMKLDWTPAGTEWGDYYSFTNYSEDATELKQKLIQKFSAKIQPETIWDLGGNIGIYSRAAARQDALVVCWDIDPAAVEKNYRKTRDANETGILPLIQDLTNPSKGLGWAHEERSSLADRGPVDMVMALALIHHLAISNNVPLDKIASFFSRLGRYLLIEFVPKEDSQVQKLLLTRDDIFSAYSIEGFYAAFSNYFTEVESIAIEGTVRTLVLFQSKAID